MSPGSNYGIAIPTYNDEVRVTNLVRALRDQCPAPTIIVVLDSSTDSACAKAIHTMAENIGPLLMYRRIVPSEFDHGGTRNLGLALMPDGVDALIFLTQDALPESPDMCSKLANAVCGEKSIGAATARQVADATASPREQHFRSYRYPPTSAAIELSNVCTAYSVSALRSVSGFPNPADWGEDVQVGRRLRAAGFKTVYCPELTVIHCHNFTTGELFRRAVSAGRAGTAGRGGGYGDRNRGNRRCYLYSGLLEVNRAGWHELVRFGADTVARVAGYILGRIPAELTRRARH
jgi:rhamnosyltransferase